MTSTTLTAASGTLSKDREARRRGWRIAGVAIITVLAGIAVYAAVDGDQRIASGPSPAATPPAALPVSEPPPGDRPAEPPPAAGSGTAPAPASASASGEPPAAAPRSVHLALDSRPRGATVVVAGVAVGITPFAEDVPAGTPGRVYTLKKPGYEPVTATLDTARDGSRQLELKKLPAPPRPAANPDLGDRGVNPFDH